MNKKLLVSAGIGLMACSAYCHNDLRPNVIFIYADDLGRGMLSRFGQEIIKTPNIDRLFREGTSFENAYGCFYSAPARAGMLTGYSDVRSSKWNISRGGDYKNITSEADLRLCEDKADAIRRELKEGDLLLPQVFGKAGYVTAEIGKLDWGFMSTRKQMKEHGWDYYYGYLDHAHAHCFYPHYLIDNGRMEMIEGNTHPTSGRGFESESPENYAKRWNMEGKKHYSQNLFIDKILKFMEANKDRPFFLYHSTQLPHGPVAIPSVHPSVRDNKNLSEIEKEYASMVLMLDEHVGMIMDKLKELGLEENTIVVFSVDNGHETYYTNGNNVRKGPVRDVNGNAFDTWDYVYTSRRAGDKFDGNDGFSGKKWSNCEGGIRVPLVFRFPAGIRAGKVLNQLVCNYDLLPTFADMLNVPLSTEKDGVSLFPLLFEAKDSLSSYRFVVNASDNGSCIVDSEGWKLRYNKKRNVYRLFYLPEDYQEQTDLKDINKDKYEQLRQELTRFESRKE